MPISVKTAKKFIDAIPWAKIGKKAATASKGQRLYPSQTHDKKLNFRLDKGAKIDDKTHEVIMQANKGADDPEVKKSADKDSHRILAKATIDPKSVDEKSAKSKLVDSFKANNK